MVLVNFLIRWACVVCGAATLGVAVYYTLDVFGNWYGPRYIRSDEDISQIYIWFLGIWFSSMIVGGLTGDWLYRRCHL